MKDIIKKLNNVYENSTLGDIPLIIKELEQKQKEVNINLDMAYLMGRISAFKYLLRLFEEVKE